MMSELEMQLGAQRLRSRFFILGNIFPSAHFIPGLQHNFCNVINKNGYGFPDGEVVR
ncbi:hypothetical protein SAMN05216313_103118 [Enterocloster lavalensis]|uniref:Uncharacterized protein n=1 Tax=Enterocloster lavalensis TaxID=460384 RepID=A0A1I0CSH2_9FIRM|nr:hypothetical protein SAMN05216313_103118 [Enterocloster lavalensis]